MNRYIYKLTFESGKTYVGQRTYKFENISEDTYLGSSGYHKRHPEDKIINKEILIDNIKDRETLNLLETIAIMDEKSEQGDNCVNFNYGGFILKYFPQKGVYHRSEEAKRKTKETCIKKYGENYASIISKTKWNDVNRKKLSDSRKKYFKNMSKEEHIEYCNKLKGRIPWNKGINSSDELRKKLSESHMGLKHSESSKIKQSNNIKEYYKNNPEEKLNRQRESKNRQNFKKQVYNTFLALGLWEKSTKNGFGWNKFQQFLKENNLIHYDGKN